MQDTPLQMLLYLDQLYIALSSGSNPDLDQTWILTTAMGLDQVDLSDHLFIQGSRYALAMARDTPNGPDTALCRSMSQQIGLIGSERLSFLLSSLIQSVFMKARMHIHISIDWWQVGHSDSVTYLPESGFLSQNVNRTNR